MNMTGGGGLVTAAPEIVLNLWLWPQFISGYCTTAAEAGIHQ